MRRRLAFTLIGLPVVIAIITVLVGLYCRPCRRSGEAASHEMPEQPQATRAGHSELRQCQWRPDAGQPPLYLPALWMGGEVVALY